MEGRRRLGVQRDDAQADEFSEPDRRGGELFLRGRSRRNVAQADVWTELLAMAGVVGRLRRRVPIVIAGVMMCLMIGRGAVFRVRRRASARIGVMVTALMVGAGMETERLAGDPQEKEEGADQGDRSFRQRSHHPLILRGEGGTRRNPLRARGWLPR